MPPSTDRHRTGHPVLQWSRREPCRPSTPIEALLDAAGAVAGLHVLVIGPDGLDAACGLHGRGAAAVTLVRSGRCARPEPADMALVPHAATEGLAAFAVGHAARALRPSGRLILRCAPAAEPALIRCIRACLVEHGFVAGCTLMQADRAVLAARVPLPGQLRYAS